MPPRRWEQTQKLAGPPVLDRLPSASTTPNSVPKDVTTQTVTYTGSQFIPENLEGRSLNFLIDTECTGNLLSLTAYDKLPP